MTASPIQGAKAAGAGSVASITATFTALNAGELVTVGVGWVDGAGTITCTVADDVGTPGQAYTAIPLGKIRNATNTYATQVFYLVSRRTTGSTVTVTATFSTATTFRNIAIERYSSDRGWPLEPFDRNAGATGSGTALNSGNMTPRFDGELIIGWGSHNSGTLTAAGSFTARQGNATDTMLEDLFQTTAAAVAATETASVADQWTMIGASFTDAPAYWRRPVHLFIPAFGPGRLPLRPRRSFAEDVAVAAVDTPPAPLVVAPLVAPRGGVVFTSAGQAGPVAPPPDTPPPTLVVARPNTSRPGVVIATSGAAHDEPPVPAPLVVARPAAARAGVAIVGVGRADPVVATDPPAPRALVVTPPGIPTRPVTIAQVGRAEPTPAAGDTVIPPVVVAPVQTPRPGRTIVGSGGVEHVPAPIAYVIAAPTRIRPGVALTPPAPVEQPQPPPPLVLVPPSSRRPGRVLVLTGWPADVATDPPAPLAVVVARPTPLRPGFVAAATVRAEPTIVAGDTAPPAVVIAAPRPWPPGRALVFVGWAEPSDTDECPPPTIRPDTGTTTHAVALLTRPDTGTTARPSNGITAPPAGTTSRPSTGVTTHAGGTTARPSSGTTSRPSTGTTAAAGGTTARPDTGVTEICD